MANYDGQPYSKLCPADKLAVALTPTWLYLFCGALSKELPEFMKVTYTAFEQGDLNVTASWANAARVGDHERWLAGLKAYLKAWAFSNAYPKENVWTAS
jgi:hypothetical protein